MHPLAHQLSELLTHTGQKREHVSHPPRSEARYQTARHNHGSHPRSMSCQGRPGRNYAWTSTAFGIHSDQAPKGISVTTCSQSPLPAQDFHQGKQRRLWHLVNPVNQDTVSEAPPLPATQSHSSITKVTPTWWQQTRSTASHRPRAIQPGPVQWSIAMTIASANRTTTALMSCSALVSASRVRTPSACTRSSFARTSSRQPHTSLWRHHPTWPTQSLTNPPTTGTAQRRMTRTIEDTPAVYDC